MNVFIQILATFGPPVGGLIGFVALFYMIIKLEHKMELGFKELRAEMKEGFLRVDNHLADHGREIKGIKKRVKKHEKILQQHILKK